MPRYLSFPFLALFRPHTPATNAVRLSSDNRSCKFQEEEPLAASVCCVLEQDTLSSLLPSSQL